MSDIVVIFEPIPTIEVIVEKAPDVVIEFPSSQGASGPPGKSAYELAVENGFVGTEEQWLASLEVEWMFDNYPDDLLASYQIAKL